jgi:cell division transport system ATP-binding protein
MATHDRMIVDAMKKRVIELKNGKIIRDTKEGEYYNVY